MAEGTLLMHWQEKMETSNVFFSSKVAKKVCTAGTRERLPAKRKKNAKVRSRA